MKKTVKQVFFVCLLVVAEVMIPVDLKAQGFLKNLTQKAKEVVNANAANKQSTEATTTPELSDSVKAIRTLLLEVPEFKVSKMTLTDENGKVMVNEDGTEKYYYLNQGMYFYRQNNQSATHSYNISRYKTLSVSRSLKKYLLNHNLFDEYEDEYNNRYIESLFSEFTLLFFSDLKEKDKKNIYNCIQRDYMYDIADKDIAKSNLSIDKKMMMYIVKKDYFRLAHALFKLRYALINLYMNT